MSSVGHPRCHINDALRVYIDHFQKWRPTKKYFEGININVTNLILKWVIQKNFYSETRLVRLIKCIQKNFKLVAIYKKGLCIVKSCLSLQLL